MEKMKTVIVDPEFPIEEWEDTTAPCNTRMTYLTAYDLRLRSRANCLGTELYWRAMGHAGVLHLIDKMANIDREVDPAAYEETYQEMLMALDYALSQSERLAKKQAQQ